MVELFPDRLFELLAEPGDDMNKGQLAGFIHSIQFPHHALDNAIALRSWEPILRP